jgi:hypothetical protein
MTLTFNSTAPERGLPLEGIMDTLKPAPQTLDEAHDQFCDKHLDSFEMLTQREYDELRAKEKARGLIIFEGDYVTLVDEPEWLEVVEIIIVNSNPENNMLKLSDGYVVPAPIERYVDEVISKKEFIAFK